MGLLPFTSFAAFREAPLIKIQQIALHFFPPIFLFVHVCKQESLSDKLGNYPKKKEIKKERKKERKG